MGLEKIAEAVEGCGCVKNVFASISLQAMLIFPRLRAS